VEDLSYTEYLTGSLTEFYTLLGPERCATLEAVSMDFGSAFRTATKQAAPQARICGDPFHLLKLVSDTVDAVRRRTLNDIKDPQVRWALLKRPDHLTDHQQLLLDQLATNETDAWRAWAQREQLRAVLHTAPDRAGPAVDDWLRGAHASTVGPVRNLARRLQAHRELIINTIELRLSNGRLEGTNSKIRLLNHRGYGHHRPEALISLILLACSSDPN
jgi:transposase